MAPKIKFRKKKATCKQQKDLKNNLLRIAIRIDEYIYENKPMCVKEAQKLLDELTTYKSKCEKDEKYLQIIDKKSRILRGIIAEVSTNVEIGNIYDKITTVTANLNTHNITPEQCHELEKPTSNIKNKNDEIVNETNASTVKNEKPKEKRPLEQIENSVTTTSIEQNTAPIPDIKKPKPLKVTSYSWIENIKYVREIANEEYHTSLKDSLENCIFPQDWN